MRPEEFTAIATRIWGEHWVVALATAVDIDRSQVWRYANGKSLIPGVVAAVLHCWLRRFVETGERP